MMQGMARSTGTALGGTAHLAQSVVDVLSTPIGSRVMRRDYGSLLFDLIDQPYTAATRLRLFAAVAVALLRWEPRLRLTRVAITSTSPGAVTLSLTGERTDVARPAPLSLPPITVSRSMT